MIHFRSGVTTVAGALALIISGLPFHLAGAAHTPPFSSAHSLGAGSSWLAQVRYIYHGLSVVPPQGRKQRATTKMPLFQQYGLETAQSQKGSIAFHDDTTVAINQKTQAVLQSAHVTYVKRGEIAQYLAPGTDHQIKTASARASAHGTTFDVEVSGNQTTFVVLHGALQVQTTAGSVVVKSNQAAVTAPNQTPEQPKAVNAKQVFAWTDQIPTPDLGEDVALDANGGSIEAYSSQREGNGGRWHADRMIDGLLTEGWESADGKVKNQWVKISFGGDNLYRIGSVVIDPAATHGDSPGADLKDFEVRVSVTGTKDSDFTRVFVGTCRQENKLRRFVLPVPVLARYVELFMRDNYGDSRHLAVAELEVVATESSFDNPGGLAVDGRRNIYVADTGNDRIVKLSPKGKELAAWGTKGSAPGQFRTPWGMAVDRQGNVYVADYNNSRIQKFSPTGQPLAQWGTYGRDPGQFMQPRDVKVNQLGNVYVSDEGNNRIQELSSSGRPLAQWGTYGTEPGQFSTRTSLAIDARGNVYVADEGNSRIEKFTAAGKLLSVWPLTAKPDSIAVVPKGEIYAVTILGPDWLRHIVKLSPSGKVIAEWLKVGSGRGQYLGPDGLAVDAQGNVYLSDSYNNRIDKFSPSGRFLDQWGLFGTVSQILGWTIGVATDAQDNVYVTDVYNARIQMRSPSGAVQAVWGRPTVAGNLHPALGAFNQPWGVAVDPQGTVYVADAGNNRLQRLTATGPLPAITSFGDQIGTMEPLGVALDPQGNIYVTGASDGWAGIVKLSPTGQPLANWGSYGSGLGKFSAPEGVALDPAGNIYISDADNNQIQKLSPSGQPLALWGTKGSDPGQFDEPSGLAVDAQGNIYVADARNHRVQKLFPDPTSGALVPLAAWGEYGPGPDQFNGPKGVALDSQGNVYVADFYNYRVVKRSPEGRVLAIWE